MEKLSIVISIIHEKGGASKSTISLALAYWLVSKGFDTILVDADTSETCKKAIERRAEQEGVVEIPLVSITGKSLKNQIRNMKEKYDFIVIDTPGRKAIEMNHGLLVSDLVVIPTLPSQPDLDALEETLEMFDTAKEINEDLLGVVLVSRASTNIMVADGQKGIKYLKENTDTEDYEGIAIYDEPYCERIVHRKAIATGRTVFEIPEEDNNLKGATELGNFFEAILSATGVKMEA